MDGFSDSSNAFGVDTPVLRLPYRRAVSDSRWLLWPVFAWRVVAPLPVERKLNLFQRAVLSLARAGVIRVGAISECLLFSADLAARVILELQGMGMMDVAGAPTARGIRELDEDGAVTDGSNDPLRMGHVLTDALDGQLWSRFLPGDLPFANVEQNDKGFPVLLSGSVGDPWRDPAFCLLPGAKDQAIESRPNPRDILKAVRRHRCQRQIEGSNDDFDVPRLARISYMDEVATPYLLAIRARRHDSGDWLVEDPFGHGEAIELRRKVEERLDSRSGLRKWLAPLVGENGSDSSIGHFQVEAAWKVEERLTLSIRLHEPVRERLVAMQRALLEASCAEAPIDKWDDVLLKAQRSVERILHTIHAGLKADGPALFSALAKLDSKLNGKLLDAIALSLGFSSPLPATLSSVRRGKVEHAERYGSGSLRPLLLLALLAADRFSDHPFRSAARSNPHLLHQLDALASARDRAAHDSASVWPETVSRHVEATFVAAELLLLSS